MSEAHIYDHKSISCALKEAFVRISDGNRHLNVRVIDHKDMFSFTSQSSANFYSNGIAVTTVDSLIIIPYTSICFVEVSSHTL